MKVPSAVQRNVVDAFATLMRRLDEVYQSHGAQAPPDFSTRIDYWRASCGLPEKVHALLHTLRIWRNASEHHDEERWVREGPRSAAEGSGGAPRPRGRSPSRASRTGGARAGDAGLNMMSKGYGR